MRIAGYLMLVTMLTRVGTVQAATLTVDSFDGAGCNFIEAITATENNTAGTGPCAGSVTGVFGADTILLTSNQPYRAQTLLSPPHLSIPVIRDKLTVIGVGTMKTVQRDPAAPELRLFTLVTGARLTLKNIRFRNFRVSNDTFADGAVVRGQGDIIVNLENTVFDGNTAEYSGGAINLFGSAADKKAILVVERSSFVNNQAQELPANGGLAVGGAIELQNYFNLVIRNSIFSGNQADGCGALAWNGNGNDIELVNNTFSGNTASEYAGAICGTSRDGNGTVWFANNIIAGNQTTGTGRTDVYFSYALANDVVVAKNNLIGSDSSSVINGYNASLPISDAADGNILAYSDASTPLALEAIVKPITEHQGMPYFPIPQTSPAVDAGTIGTYIPGAVLSFWRAGCRGTSKTLIPSFDFHPDQLNRARPVGTACDIGAIEYRDESTCYAVKTSGEKVVAFCL